jgi:CubicO group peptidase (beta-lactamase class C family)
MLIGLVLLSTLAAAGEGATYVGLPNDAFMREWLVLTPIPVSAAPAPDEAAQKEAFATDLLAAAGGETGVLAKAGARVKIAGADYEWRRLQGKGDVLTSDDLGGQKEFAIAYAWADVLMKEKASVLLGIGSDDGVKVWLNGKLVHENWIGRAAQIDDDVVPVELPKGRSRLLLKIQNMQGPWGFVCRPMGQRALTEKLEVAARLGDLEMAGRMLDHGADADATGKVGLSAAQAARVRGQKEVVALLASRGADVKAPLPPPERLVDSLFNSLIKADSPGAAVLVARDGHVLFEKGYGLARVQEHVPAAPTTKFRIGSITKQFTAAAILKLQEEGRISVEDHLSKFYPDYPRGDEVTIHHLLTHTSGIHSFTDKPDFIASVTTPVKTEDQIRSFEKDPFDFDPGQRFLYNNSGYFLLGAIVEKVSGQPYADYLRSKFFEPLGMKDTGVHRSDVALDHEALGYEFADGAFKRAADWDMSRAGGAGALYSTIEDLNRWNEALFGGKVLSQASLEAAFTPVRIKGEDPAVPKESGYGYGFSVANFRGVPEIGHGGGLQGFVSYLLRLPKLHFTVAVLVNASPPAPGVNPGSLAHDVAELYLGETLPPRERPAVDAEVSAEAKDAVVGRYDYGGAVLTVTREGDRLYAQLTRQPKFEIFPKTESTFFWKVVEAEVTFVKDDKGKVVKAIHKQGGQTIDAPRLEDLRAVKLDAKALDAVVGRYDYGGGKTILTVTREGERLFAELTGQPRFEIFPKSETEFFWKVVNAEVTFVKDKDGKVTKGVHRQGGKTFDAPRME